LFIYCYGDVPFFLKYDILKNFWAAIKYDPSSHYKGTLRYSSICKVGCSGLNSGDSDMLIMTGGVHISNGEPVADAYRINVQNTPSIMMKICDMNKKRFGHCSLDIKGTLYVFGGFCH
jgi:hypothetical protein